MSLLNRKLPAPDVRSLQDRIWQLETELLAVKHERDVLQDLIDAMPKLNIGSGAWLMSKVSRQRKALDRLHDRVAGQRFVLRTLEGLGRTLSPEEFRWAREHDAGTSADRIDAFLASLVK